MWTVEQIVDDSTEIVSCGTIEECLKAANRECITVYESRRGDGSLIIVTPHIKLYSVSGKMVLMLVLAY